MACVLERREKRINALDELKRPASSLSNRHIEGWRGKGGKVIGYYCTYVPGEIIHAARMMPFRMRATGSTSTELGDVYAAYNTCTFCRHSLDQAMRGAYHFLDGLVALFSCDHIRRMYDVWRLGKVELPWDPFYFHFLSVPVKADDAAVEWLAEELGRFRRTLEEHFQVAITDEALGCSIKEYNEQRRLLRSLYQMRKRQAPPVSGTEVLQILIAATSMPVEEFNGLLRQALDEVGSREGITGYRARVLLGGVDLEDPEYVKLIEDLGGLVVADFLCFGIRDFWEPVEEDVEPVTALARRYIRNVSCPRMIDHDGRQQFIESLIDEYGIDGVIIQRMKYCDLWGGESAMIQWDMRKNGTPCMVLEREYLMGSLGQMRTRVQAFLETIGSY
ncbi:MAG: 2-hydroxyacyl-CoA dehydratase subunit D [Chloroflexota bacterium]